MIIEMVLTEREPPAGSVRADGREISFEGWLGAIQALQDLVAPAATPEQGEASGPSPR